MGKRVLVVENSKAQREAICRIMETFGWHALAAQNGKRAMEQVMLHDGIDLITLDWHMPVMDGLEFLSIFRAMPFSRTTKVLMLSGERAMSDIVKAIAAGADEYLIKPFTIEMFSSTLKKMGFITESSSASANVAQESVGRDKMVAQ